MVVMDKFLKLKFILCINTILLPALSKADTCGVSQSCFRSPEDCFPASSCTYFVGWSLSNSGDSLYFEFSMSGANGYIALGFSKDGNMAMSDIIGCLSDSRVLRYYAESRTPPSRQNDVGLSNEEINIGDDNAIQCSFTRQLSLDGETNFYNLNEAHFLIIAKGNRGSGDALQQHAYSERWMSTSAYDLKAADFRTMTTQQPEPDHTDTSLGPTTLPPPLSPSGDVTTLVVPTPEVTTTPVVISDPPMKSDDDTCGVSQSCFRKPENCFPSSSCDYFVGWSVSQSGEALDFEFRMSGDNGYIAVGFSKDGNMDNSDIVGCLSNGDVYRYYASTKSTPSKQDSDGLNDEEVILGDDGVLRCTFTRQLSLEGQSNFFNLNEDHFLIVAKGALSGETLQYHSTMRYKSLSGFDLTSAPFSASGSDDDNYQTKIKAHGSLMIIGWIGFVSIGIVTARFFKKAWPNTTVCGKNIWFRIHSTCMITAWLTFASSFILIFVTAEGWVGKDKGDNTFYHAIIGTTAVGLGTLNPIMAIFRPHPGTPRRPIFNVLHFGVGFLGWLSAIVATFFGVRIYYMDSDKVTDIDAFNVLIGFAIFLVLMFIAFELHGHCSKNKDTPGDIPLDSIDSITDTPFGQEKRNMRSAPTQENPTGTAVKTILYILYIAGVFLTVGYLVVTIVIKDV